MVLRIIIVDIISFIVSDRVMERLHARSNLSEYNFYNLNLFLLRGEI